MRNLLLRIGVDFRLEASLSSEEARLVLYLLMLALNLDQGLTFLSSTLLQSVSPDRSQWVVEAVS